MKTYSNYEGELESVTVLSCGEHRVTSEEFFCNSLLEIASVQIAHQMVFERWNQPLPQYTLSLVLNFVANLCFCCSLLLHWLVMVLPLPVAVTVLCDLNLCLL